MRRVIFLLILLGGYAGGLGVGADVRSAAVLGPGGVVLAGAGAWLLYDRVERRRP